MASFFSMSEQEIKEETSKQPETIFVSAGKKWLWLGILIAFLNPIFAGLILGAAYLSEPNLKKEGRIVGAVAILWGAASFYLARQIFPAIF